MKLSDLIDYLIDEPLPEIDGRKASYYPFIACEMLTDAPEVLDLFFADPIYLDQLFSFLQKDYINATSAGYFSTVAQNLLERNPRQLVGYLFVKYDYGLDIVRHIGTRAVLDFLCKLIHCDPGLSQFALDKLSLLESLSLYISNDSADEEILNAEGALADVIENCRDMKGWRVYMALLMQDKLAAAWCQALLAPRETWSAAAARLVTALLDLPDYAAIARINYEDVDRAIKKQLGKPCPPAALTPSSPPLQSHIAPLIPQLVDVLKPACSPLFRGKLGQRRIAFVGLLTALAKTASVEITEVLMEASAVPVVVALFQAQPWSSFLHTAFHKFVVQLVDGENAVLRRELIVEGRLPLVLAQIAKDPFETKGKSKRRKGYMGHVTKISNFLLASESVRDLLAQLSSNQHWTTFLSSYLAPRTAAENSRLGGGDRLSDCPFQEVTNTLPARNLSPAKDCEKSTAPAGRVEQLVECVPDPNSFLSSVYWRLTPAVNCDLPALD